MDYTEIVEEIKKKAVQEGIDLESLGLYEIEDFVYAALCFLYHNLGDLEPDSSILNAEDFEDEMEEEL